MLRMQKLLLTAAVVLLMPYVATLAISGNVLGTVREESPYSGRRVYLDGQGGYVDAEEYLIGVVALQIPMEYEIEAVKAQAVIARTWLYRRMDGNGQVSVSELNRYTGENTAYLPEEGIRKLWGEEHFPEYYEKARRAVAETAGQVICYDGELIEPLFHRASAGQTRSGGLAYPYLQAADSSFDVEAEGYLTVKEWTPEEFAALAAGAAEKDAGGEIAGDADRILASLQLVSRDSSGYVAEYQIGSHIYTGEEVREIFGLPSLSFTFRNHEGNIQAVCEGQGHALGMSQYGAHHLAMEGLSAGEILEYYYHAITIEMAGDH